VTSTAPGSSSGHEVTLLTVEAEPAAVVAAGTTWPELPSLWSPLPDEVWTVIRAGGAGAEKAGHNVMLDKDDVPITPCPLSGRG
jgi:hypothetical protein